MESLPDQATAAPEARHAASPRRLALWEVAVLSQIDRVGLDRYLRSLPALRAEEENGR